MTSGSGRSSDFGTPRCSASGRRDRWAILALGKFGGRELNYHSDLDLVFLHEADGHTPGERVLDLQRAVCHRGCPADLESAWAAVRRPVRSTWSTPGFGRTGPRARLVQTLASFLDYFRQSTQVWERMTLTRARVIFATGGFGREVSEAIRSLLTEPVDPARVGEKSCRCAGGWKHRGRGMT